MENNELKKYINKIKIESIIKSIIYGLINGFITFTLLNLILYIFNYKNILLVLLLSILIWILSSIFIYLYKMKPSINNVAKRIDELGLQERIVTMVEYRDSDDYMAQRQRDDALESLKRITSNELKFKFSKYSFVILAITMVLGIFTSALPNPSSNISNSNSNNSSILNSSCINNSSSSSSSIEEELDEEDIIKKLLEELRRIIDRAAIDEDVKDELHAIVDQLEIDLEGVETLEEKIKIIEEKRQEIKDRIAYELLRMSIGRCLQQHELTKELGVAIYEEDLDKVDAAIDNLIFNLSVSETPIDDAKELIEYLNEALAIADKEKNDALIAAIQDFADTLTNIIEGGEVQQTSFKPQIKKANEDETSNIIDAIIEAGEEIKDALRKSEETQIPEEGEQTEEEVEGTGDELDDAMNEALDDLKDKLEQDSSQDNQGGEQEGNEGNTPPPIFDNEDIESETVIDGETPYLDVYDEYAELIKGWLESGDIPDEYKELVEKYLEMIKE